MTFQAGAFFTSEIFNRIGGRLTQPQIVPYLNEALGIITAAGSFSWDQSAALGVLTTAGATYAFPTGTLDTGKKITVLNTASKTPVSKVPQEEYALSAAGYVDQVPSEFNSFQIAYAAGVGGFLQMYPISVGISQIDIFFHLLPPVLTSLVTPTVRWDIPFMDSVLLDMTEGACKRILSWADWQDREAAGRSKLQEAVRIFSTDRINTGTAQENANAVQEKTQLGRT